MNQVILFGNVGREPELTFDPKGRSRCKLSVATNERFKDNASGEWKTLTDWHVVVIWGKHAEIAAERLTKGAQVFVRGKVRTRDYEKNGEKRWITEVVADDVEFVNAGGGGGGGRHRGDATPDDHAQEQQAYGQQQSRTEQLSRAQREDTAPQRGPQGGKRTPDPEDDIPF